MLILAAGAVSAVSNHTSKELGDHQALELSETITADANALKMFVYNDGNFAYDNIGYLGRTDGLYYPRGTNKTVVYAAGLWLGCKVDGQYRIAMAEYSSEFRQGPMVGGESVPNWTDHRYRVYKISSGDSYENPDYADWPEDDGAPVDDYGDPLLLGDQTMWSVFNDADSTRHNNGAGSTLPLGVEVQHTTIAYARSGALGNVIFLKFKIINKGIQELDSTYVSIWCDPDLGDAGDDLVGCDTNLSLGYCYNDGSDDIYGSAPPAVGFDFFQGPIVPSPGDTAYVSGEMKLDYRNLPMTSFNKYINGEDPQTAEQSYLFMTGLKKDPGTGTMVPAVDPITGDTTTFVTSGDPVTGTGWLDNNSADRRFMLSSGPFAMSPGDTQEVVTAVLVGQGNGALNSITRLKEIDVQAQAVFDSNFDIPQASSEMTLYARGWDGAVELIWDSEPVNFISENYILNQRFVFEGFNLYQGDSPSGPWHKFATYDNINDIALIYNDVINPDLGGIERIIVQNGSNSGIVFRQWLEYSQIEGTPLENGETYYFAATWYAYDENHVTEFLDQYGNLLGHLTPMLESPIAAIAISPEPYPYDVDTADHIAGSSDGMVLIDYIYPAGLTGHDYRVTFNLDGTWNLTDMITLENLIQNNPNQGPGYDYPVTDGFMARVYGPSLGVGAVEEVANRFGPLAEPDNVHRSANSTWDWYIDPGSQDLSRYSWQGGTTHDYEIRFTASSSESCFDWFGQGDYAYVNNFLVPIEVWDLGVGTPDDPGDDRRICFMIIDDDYSQSFNFGDGIYFWDIDYDVVNWSEPGDHSGNYDPDHGGLHYGRFWFYDYSGLFDRPSDGTIVRITSNKINATSDIFAFTGGYQCGDIDGSGSINVSDAVALLGYIFGGGDPPLDISGGDVNCDGAVNITDVVYLIAYIFGGGPEPCAACP